MITELELSDSSFKAAVVVSRFNGVLTDRLLDGALKALSNIEDVLIVRVPGSFELPLACSQISDTGKFDFIVALGVVIKGETDHDRLIVDSVSAGIAELSLKKNIPIGFGLLSLSSLDQAEGRCGEHPKENKGFEAACAALEMAQVGRSLRALKRDE